MWLSLCVPFLVAHKGFAKGVPLGKPLVVKFFTYTVIASRRRGNPNFIDCFDLLKNLAMTNYIFGMVNSIFNIALIMCLDYHAIYY